MDDRYLLAQIIRQAHNYLQTQLRNNNLMLGEIHNKPVRIVILDGVGILRQYHINNNSVRLDYFFTEDFINIYDLIRDRFPNGNDHNFGHEILGNGANDGATRSIYTNIDLGANSFNNDGFKIAIQSVNKMMTLINHIEPHLPNQYRIPISYPVNYFRLF